MSLVSRNAEGALKALKDALKKSKKEKMLIEDLEAAVERLDNHEVKQHVFQVCFWPHHLKCTAYDYE